SWRIATTDVSGGRRRWIRSTKGSAMRVVTQSRWPKTKSAGRWAQAVTNGRSVPSRSGRERCGNGCGGWNFRATSGRHELGTNRARDHARRVPAVQQLLDGLAAALADVHGHVVDPHPDEPVG